MGICTGCMGIQPRTEDRGAGKGQKVILRFRCYRTFRGKACFYFFFVRFDVIDVMV